MHSVISEAVITKKTRITGRELRFLRTKIGLSGAMLAKRLGLAKETVSRWENGRQAIPINIDITMRLLSQTAPDRSYDLHDLILNEGIVAGDKKPPLIKLKKGRTHWRLDRVA